MGKCNCECRLGCIGISVVASLIIGIVAAFLTFSAVITLAPAFLWAALGTAVVFLALLLGYGLFTGATGSSDCECPIIRTVIAGILGAESLISMTDIEGILRDKNDPSTLISKILVDEAPQLVEEGVISGGMIPKVECCIDAITHGVENVVIMDGRVPHSILMELLTDEGAGTMVTGE